MKESVLHKLTILAESAKYDVSCSSSGTIRRNKAGMTGSTSGWGICHSFTEDGRCVSLLKILLTNFCLFDCAYCVNRRSNDIERVAFTPGELAELTIEFYRRNYIEGLFLSSGVIKSPDHTMEKMLRVVKDLRTIHHFNGYIHMKTIPGASQELVHQAGLYADRLSVNLEIPLEQDLKLLAPEKDHQSVYKPMHYIQQGMVQSLEERRKFRSAPRFAPAGQSTQIIVGAAKDNDKDILHLSSALYQRQSMKRVYYSGYIPVNTYDKRLPVVKDSSLKRENRLYQADWLMRFYQFNANEILDDKSPYLDLDMDPKLAWAIRHPERFPVDVNTADYATILRIPGVGVKSAKMIMVARKHGRLNLNGLKKIGVVLKRAQYFITNNELPHYTIHEATPEYVKRVLRDTPSLPSPAEQQLSFGFTD
ncbi:putative DNA modification/repair radical SAM protein [Limnobaculum zhutongyuii]|uniref:Putative DNA modification/repair radical SAM protein n=1 Tax=Limnobaculum zhutongyuii TaxID=2498113 RepID=A0A411WJE7_9GAMM|nr:putative DNA modification/repair radical SAM protein [Limnobaculum zhutongyuii]QBH96296.1 putative DNA modification/repair radical SAM protein [Limnobaculum zhutongyuii]TQS87115.1 putative DNA modification/repair radical SAM protein [Limnobaculum zhutongyuii]